MAEAQWQDDGTVVPVAAPGDGDVALILARVLRAAKKDWADLEAAWPEEHTFGNDVLRCPCGGRRSIRAVHSTRKQAEARLTELGVTLPSRVLPPATAPPQLLLAM